MLSTKYVIVISPGKTNYFLAFRWARIQRIYAQQFSSLYPVKWQFYFVIAKLQMNVFLEELHSVIKDSLYPQNSL